MPDLLQSSKSYWEATSRYASSYPLLDRDIDTDVAVIGAGFTGLSAAHHLHRLGRPCTILEAHQVGWGASGRNGGMVVPRYKLTYPELDRTYGRDTALSMYRLAHEAVDTLEGIVRDCSLSCGFARKGHLTPIQYPTDVARFEADLTWLQRHAGDSHPSMLGCGEVAAAVGSEFYRGGYFEPRGGGIHPLEYCQSLAASLNVRGIGIYCRTPVQQWSTDSNGVTLQTPRARVRARELFIATNGYTDLTSAGDALKRRIVPIASALISTAPLDSQQRSSVLAKIDVATDSKRLTNYYRVMPDGRFVFGGRGGASSKATARVYARLANEMIKIFPQLCGIPIEHRWYGLVAVTLDSLPHIGRLGPRVAFAMGYSGRGVALSALLGHRLARLSLGETPDLGPMSHGRFSNIPFHALRVPAKQVAISYMQIRDLLGL